MHAQKLKKFYIVYYCMGRNIKTLFLPESNGYALAQKHARMMAVGLMASAVHPDDAAAMGIIE